MLHPIYLLSNSGQRGWQVRQSSRRSWQATAVIPRELCIFEAVSCKGVKWHELDGFARLQAARLAPFIEWGGNAVVRGSTLMFWFWDQSEIDTAFAGAAIDASGMRKYAETLMLDVPRRSGEFSLQCSSGSDLLTLQDGAIVASTWVADKRAATTRRVDLRARPWARERLGRRRARSAAASGWTAANVLSAASLAALTLAGAYAAYWGGRINGIENRIVALEAGAEGTVSSAGEIERLRRSAAVDDAWADRYLALGSSLDVNALLDALAGPLQAHRVVLKEFEIRDDAVSLTLLSAGGEIDLPALLRSFEAMPGVTDVQVRQNADPGQASYSMRAGGFRRAPRFAASAGPTASPS